MQFFCCSLEKKEINADIHYCVCTVCVSMYKMHTVLIIYYIFITIICYYTNSDKWYTKNNICIHLLSLRICAVMFCVNGKTYIPDQ